MYSKNLLSSMVLQLFKLIFKFVLGVLVARELGATRYGEVTYFFLIFGLISSYGHLGIINAIAYFAKNDKVELKKQFSINVSYLLFNVVFLLLIIHIPFVRTIVFGDMPYEYLWYGIIYVLFCYLFATFESYYVDNNLLYKSNYCVICTTILVTIFTIIMLYLNLINITTYILVQILEYVIIVVFQYNMLGQKYKPQINFSFLYSEFKYGQNIFWASLFGYLNYRVDQLMLKSIYGNTELGVYSIAVSLAELIFLVPNSVSTSITAKLFNTETENERKRILVLTLKIMTIICVIMSIVGFLLAPLITILYGQEYVMAIDAFRILLFGVVFASVAKMVYPFYLVKGEAKIHLNVTAIIFVLNVVLNFILIPVYGMNGAAIASSFSYYIYGSIYIYFLYKREHINIKEIICLKKDEIKKIFLDKSRNSGG